MRAIDAYFLRVWDVATWGETCRTAIYPHLVFMVALDLRLVLHEVTKGQRLSAHGLA